MSGEPVGGNLWDHQGTRLTARELVTVLLSTAVDLDAPIVVGVLSSGGDRDLFAPLEVEVVHGGDSAAVVLWIGAAAEVVRGRGMVFEL
jgi:hypothetical protein